jgi:hypothetical protein
MQNKLQITIRVEPDGATHQLLGREAWALLKLYKAGKRGCTPIDTPGPRWSHYVFLLRRRGLVVETIHEAHGGPFAGTHARYVLHTSVSIVSELEEVA